MSKHHSQIVAVSKDLTEKSYFRLEATSTEDAGIGVQAKTALTEGSLILECQAIQIVLEPHRQHSHCGICATQSIHLTGCKECNMVRFCQTCHKRRKQLHSDDECSALRSFMKLINESLDGTSNTPIFLSDLSTHLLVIRLLVAKREPWWNTFQLLHKSSVPFYEQGNVQVIVNTLKDRVPSLEQIVTEESYISTLGRVLGCSHAVTDVSLPLGTQTLGRAVFFYHSFYNHSCAPNAFLSCSIANDRALGDSSVTSVIAKVHALRSIEANEAISLSYIPLSGLSLQERHSRLQSNYGFECRCDECRLTPQQIVLSEDADIDSIREVQYSCSERLLKQQTEPRDTDQAKKLIDEDELETVLSLVHMTQRGTVNQNLPPSHEVCMESYRLLAMGYSLINDLEQALEHHKSFLGLAAAIGLLFDPVALATQRLAYSRDLTRYSDVSSEEEASKQWYQAIHDLITSLGADHPWIKSLSSCTSAFPSSKVVLIPRSAKRQKVGDA